MPKGRKRRSDSRYDVFEAGDRIPRPDYKMFEEVCSEAAQELGLSKDEVLFLFKRYVDVSLGLMFPEKSPRSLLDDALLRPRRIMRIPGIVTAEVTEKSLRRWRKIDALIRAKRNKDNNDKTE